MSLTLTVQKIDNAMKGNDFWLNRDSEAAQIVTEAARLGYVKRSSHTQVQWTEAGLAKARAELTPVQAAAFTTHASISGAKLGPATVGEIEQARELYRQLPETYLANDFISTDRSGVRVFVIGPFGLCSTSIEWTIDNVIALCRGFGMREFKTLNAFEAFDPTAKYLRVGCEKHAELFFFDPERRLTVIPFRATSAVTLLLCASDSGRTSLYKPADAAEWLLSKYSPAPLEWKKGKLYVNGQHVAQVTRGNVDRLYYWTHADGAWGHLHGFESEGECLTACEKHFAS